METPEHEAFQHRKKKTAWLMGLGAASLLIPLAGAVYLDWRQNTGSYGPTGRNDVFERREGEDRKAAPTQSALVVASLGTRAGALAQPAGSSLDLIKGNSDMRAGTPATAAAAPASTETVAPAPTPAAAHAAQTTAAKASKPAKKPFTALKLQPSPFGSGFGATFGSGKFNDATKGAGAGNAKGLTPNSLHAPVQGASNNRVGP